MNTDPINKNKQVNNLLRKDKNWKFNEQYLTNNQLYKLL